MVAPEVSVLITAYNEEETLARAIRSVINQTFQNWELIIVDDGSTDQSFDIARNYCRQYKHIKAYRCERIGRKNALNFGASLAQGEFLAICDADDILLPKRLAKQVSFLQKNPTVGLVGSAYIRYDEIRNETYVRRYPSKDNAIRKAMALHIPMCHGTMMIRRSIMEEIGGYRFDDLEDFDLYLRAAQKWELANLSEPLYIYYLSSTTGVFHRQPFQLRRSFRLLKLNMRAIRQFRLPPWYYLLATARLTYRIMPDPLKAYFRRRVASMNEKTVSSRWIADQIQDAIGK